MIGREIGPYRLVERIGQSELGTVYKGVRLNLEQEFAIRAISPELSQDSAIRDLLIREAKIQVGLCHPNVVNVLNCVEEENDLFLVTEYICGETLESRLKRLGRIPNAVEVCISILSAMHFMHSCDIVHGDINPGNIMFLEDDYVQVMDFGIAKVAADTRLSGPGMQVGAPWYMSPERLRGEQASSSSDLYSIGTVLYQMVTGKLPFDGNSDEEVTKTNLEQEPIHPWEIDPSISNGIGSIILKAISKNKNDRYHNARQFADDLRAGVCASERQAPSGPAEPAIAPHEGELSSSHAGSSLPMARFISHLGIHFLPLLRRNRLLLSFLAAFIILIAGLCISHPNLTKPHVPKPTVSPIAPAPAPVLRPTAQTETAPTARPSTEMGAPKEPASPQRVKTSPSKKPVRKRINYRIAVLTSHHERRIGSPGHRSSTGNMKSRKIRREHRNAGNPSVRNPSVGSPSSVSPTPGNPTENPEVRGKWKIIK